MLVPAHGAVMHDPSDGSPRLKKNLDAAMVKLPDLGCFGASTFLEIPRRS